MNAAAISFHLPPELNAKEPPERRGMRRDFVKLMILDKMTGEKKHVKFYDLLHYLRKGDLLVLNASRTVPAVLNSRCVRDGRLISSSVEIRLAHRKSEQIWEALIVSSEVEIGDILFISDHFYAEVIRHSPDRPFSTSVSPFHTLRFSASGSALYDQIYAHGQPVRYEYIDVPWDLDYYQTVYSTEPGSVEMPSAGRAFSWELLRKLRRKGIALAYVQLHTGLSYLLDGNVFQDPAENYEEYIVPQETVEAVRLTKQAGGRVIAVGTTAVRSLEAAVDVYGNLEGQSGWTNLFIDRNYQLKVVDALITGFHESEASHLELLSAFLDPDMLKDAYREAVDMRYLWHEFGDMNLII